MLSRTLSCKPKKLSPGQKLFLQIGWKVDGSVLVLRHSQIGEIYFCSAEETETVLPDLQVAGHYRATQDGRRIKLVAKPFKVFSGLQLQSPFFQSPKVNFQCCRGSQMPIKWCKMFYRSFKTNFCITFLLQLYRGKTFSCKQNMQTNIMVEPWLDLDSSVVKLHDIDTATWKL